MKSFVLEISHHKDFNNVEYLWRVKQRLMVAWWNTLYLQIIRLHFNQLQKHSIHLPWNFSPVFGTSCVMSSHVVDQIGGHPKSNSTFRTRVRSWRTASKGRNGNGRRRSNEGRMNHVLSEHCRKNWNFMILRNFSFLKWWSVQKLFERGELAQCTKRCMTCQIRNKESI